MKSALFRLIPLGTSLPAARAIMESEGFEVIEEHGSSFSEQGKVHRGINYLYCDKTELWRFPVERRWQVAVVNDGARVTDILVSMGLIGP